MIVAPFQRDRGGVIVKPLYHNNRTPTAEAQSYRPNPLIRAERSTTGPPPLGGDTQEITSTILARRTM